MARPSGSSKPLLHHFTARRLAACLLLVIALGLAGCVSLADPETSQVQPRDTLFTLPADGSLKAGQSFTSRRSGLQSVTVTVEVPDTQQADLTFGLYTAKTSEAPLYQVTLRVRSGSVTVSFPAQAQPGAYQFTLQAGGAAVNLKGAQDDYYPAGSAMLNGQPTTGDLAFSTTYDYGLVEAWADFTAGLRQAWLVIPLLAVLVLPGSLLLALAPAGQAADLGEWLAYAGGLSLAVLPLVMLWTGLAGLAWSPGWLWAGALAAVGLLAWLAWRRKAWRNLHLDGIDGGFAAVILGSLLLRLAMVRDMAGPAWVDSVHHALITRLILQHGALPASFAPFFQIAPTDYHPGFHVGLAAYLWLSGTPLVNGMLLYGQFLNALAVPSVYLFTTTLTRSRPAGLAAAIFCGFCTPMPAYYTSWSRYTQLAGLIILPVVGAGFQKGLQFFTQEPAAQGARALLRKFFRGFGLPCLAAAGLLLVHYRVALFCTLFMLGWFLMRQWQEAGIELKFGPAAVLAGTASAIAALASLPWLAPLLRNTLLPLSGASTDQALFSGFSWRFLTTGLGAPVIALAVMGLVFALLLEKRFIWVLLTWTTSLVLLANPQLLHLPMVTSNNITMEISLYLPLCLLAGFAAALAIASVEGANGRWLSAALAGVALVTGLLGAQQLLPILNEGTMLLRQADLPALEWAQQSLPAGSQVAVNSFLWGYGAYAGADGGYWLEPLSGVRTLPPPVAAYANPAYVQQVTALTGQIAQVGQVPARLAEVLRQAGIAYVFSGQRGGPLSPIALAASPEFKTLYHQDSVWIFYVKP